MNKSELQAAFAAIDEKYRNKNIGLSTISVPDMSDADIRAAAEQSLSYGLTQKKESIEESAAKAAETAEKKKTAVSEAAAEKQAAVDGYYDDRRKQAESEALRRGLARSSVIMNRIEEYDKGRHDEKLTLEQKLTTALSDLDKEIETLAAQREKALLSADSAYAADLAKEIKSLTDDRYKKVVEAIKYNNTVMEKEAENEKLNRADAEKELALEKMMSARDYYEGFSGKKEAMADFEADHTLRAQLGDYYLYLLSYIQNRKY